MLVHKQRAPVSMNEDKRRFHVSVSPALRRRALLQARRAAPYRRARKRQCPASSSARRLLQTMNKQALRILQGAVQFHLVASPHPAHERGRTTTLDPAEGKSCKKVAIVLRHTSAPTEGVSNESKNAWHQPTQAMDLCNGPFEDERQPVRGRLGLWWAGSRATEKVSWQAANRPAGLGFQGCAPSRPDRSRAKVIPYVMRRILEHRLGCHRSAGRAATALYAHAQSLGDEDLRRSPPCLSGLSAHAADRGRGGAGNIRTVSGMFDYA
jgi:hypothetical protein